jgi:hypothetical protein
MKDVPRKIDGSSSLPTEETIPVEESSHAFNAMIVSSSVEEAFSLPISFASGLFFSGGGIGGGDCSSSASTPDPSEGFIHICAKPEAIDSSTGAFAKEFCTSGDSLLGD